MNWILNIKKNTRDKLIEAINAQVQSGQISAESGASAIAQVTASADAPKPLTDNEKAAASSETAPSASAETTKPVSATPQASNSNLTKYVIFGCAGVLALGIIYKLTKK